MGKAINIDFERLDEKKYNIYTNNPKKMTPQDKSEFENLVLVEMANKVLTSNILNEDILTKRIDEIKKNNGAKLLELLININLIFG